MLNIFRKNKNMLVVKTDNRTICQIADGEQPCEKNASVKLAPHSQLEFIDPKGTITRHSLYGLSGWVHLSIRLQKNLACQIDAVIDDQKTFSPASFANGATGIRFQPFFLSNAPINNDIFKGKGLFARGLHYPGTITPGNVILSCLCDICRKSFLLQSFHTGFSDSAYFYSGSGKYTLIVTSSLEGAPAALSEPDQEALKKLEANLPGAPDQSDFSYYNPLSCPHCGEAYIDFQKHPEERKREYYGNYFVGTEPVYYSLP